MLALLYVCISKQRQRPCSAPILSDSSPPWEETSLWSAGRVRHPNQELRGRKTTGESNQAEGESRPQQRHRDLSDLTCFAWKCNNDRVSRWSGDRPILRVSVCIGFQLKMLINTHRFTWICVDGSFNRCCCPLIMGLTLGCVLLSWQVCLRSQLGGWFALQGCVVIDAYYYCWVCICVNICVCFIMLSLWKWLVLVKWSFPAGHVISFSSFEFFSQ